MPRMRPTGEVELSTSPIDRAVELFREAVERQPAAIRHSLQTHTRALAATCQQSVSPGAAIRN